MFHIDIDKYICLKHLCFKALQVYLSSKRYIKSLAKKEKKCRSTINQNKTNYICRAKPMCKRSLIKESPSTF